jgi:Transposase DDE domain group 1
MSEDSTTQRLLFPGIFRKPIVAQFDQREGSSDGGALLLKAADQHYDLVAGLASCLRDDRQAGKVDHSLRELVAQRVFSIACGYPDANDSARLSGDPIHKLLLDRDPVEGRDLASQPTLSRFENRVGVKELYRLGEFLASRVIRRHAKRLRHRAYRVTIDLDPTDDPTHGAQQLSFFNGHYDTWCYLPVMGFVSFNDEAEQYLCAAVLRPGNVTAAVGAVAILRRLVGMIRHYLPGVQIRVRLDGGFAHPAVLEFLDAEPRLEYVVAMAKNAVLKRVAETGMRRARQLSRGSGKTEHIYGEVHYKAGKWPCLRRVIIKAEVVRAPDKDPLAKRLELHRVRRGNPKSGVMFPNLSGYPADSSPQPKQYRAKFSQVTTKWQQKRQTLNLLQSSKRLCLLYLNLVAAVGLEPTTYGL